MSVHILKHGAALCGLPGIPATWADGERWMPFDVTQNARTCELDGVDFCKACVKAIAEPEASGGMMAASNTTTLRDWTCNDCGGSPHKHICPRDHAKLAKDYAKLADDHGRLKGTATSAHVAITKLCREHYGDNFKDWPDHAQSIINQLGIWGCHP